MYEITDEKLCQSLVDKIYETYDYKINDEAFGGFIGLQTSGIINPFDKSAPFAVFDLTGYKPWTEKQERHINSLLGLMANKNIYAINWNHSFFVFNPRQEFCAKRKIENKTLNYYTFFPPYYPDGDNYFFIDMQWQYGLICHFNHQRIYVFGKKLIKLFQLSTQFLAIQQIYTW